MNNGLLYLGGLLAVILAALFAVPMLIDWNGYRGVFEEEASKALGRDVRVGGGVNLSFLPTPYVRFEKVRLADTKGQTGEPFVRADSFTMRLSGPALLRGVFEAKEIELAKPVLTLVVDSEGGGNWNNLKLKSSALPFVPRDVALRSVKLIDGAIALHSAQSGQIGRIDAITGELSADGLAGPFKFKGTGVWSGVEREIKFATTEPDASGAYRFKAGIRSLKLASSYAFDGKVENLGGKPTFDGELTAHFPMPEFEVGQKPDEKAAGSTTAAAPGIEMKSKLAGNALGAKFDDIAISFENAAEPQAVNGTAKSSWAGAPRIDADLNAKWLDLDAIAGAGAGGMSLKRIQQLGLGFMRALSGEGAAGAKVAIEQIKIGGETAGGLFVDAERRGGAVVLKELRAGLPGSSRLDMSGELKEGEAAGQFEGQLLVHGASLARLLQWAGKSGAHLDVKADGPFSVEGRLIAGDKRFEFTDARAELTGLPLKGEVRLGERDGRWQTAITVEGAKLDTAQFFPAKAQEIEDEIRMALGLKAAGGIKKDQSADEQKSGAAASEPSDTSLRVLAGELKTGTKTFKNVDARLEFEGGAFSVPEARFTAASGLGVVFGARVKNAAIEPKGSLSIEFDAKTPEAMKEMALMTGLGEIVPVERFEALQTARVAGLVRLGERGKGSADMSFGGTIRSARVDGRAEFDGGLSGWRTKPSRVSIDAASPDFAPVYAAIGADAPHGVTSTRPVTVSFASSGTFASSALADVRVKAEGLEANYNGNAFWPAGGQIAFAGQAGVKAKELSEVLALAHVAVPGGLAGTPLDGNFRLARKDSELKLSVTQLAVGASAVRGAVSVKYSDNSPAQISADITAGDVKVSSLLLGLTDMTAKSAPPQPGVVEDRRMRLWPEASFNLDAWKSLAGDVRLGFGALELEPGLSARDGTMAINFAPGKITVNNFAAKAAGGKLSGAARFEKAPAGVAANADVKIVGFALESLGRQAKGRGDLDLTLSGSAQSPASVIQQLSGKGSIALSDARHPGPSAGDVAQTSELVLSGKLANDPDPIKAALTLALSKSEAESGTRTIPIAIVNGAARIDPYVIDSRDGKTTVTTTVDLASLNFDSSWQIAAIVPPQQRPADADATWTPAIKGPLPPVSYVYGGQLADLGHLNTKLDAGELQRELTIRQMERNAEELERLRRKEEERVRQEQERRKALEAQKAAAAAAAAAARAAAQQPPMAVPPPPAQVPAAGAQLPPVLPDSNGSPAATPNPAGSPSAAQPQAAGAAPAAKYNTEAGGPETAPPAASVSTPAPATPPPSGQSKQVEISTEPLPPPGTEPNKAVPRPAAVSRPRAARSTRSSAEEMLRALGGTP